MLWFIYYRNSLHSIHCGLWKGVGKLLSITLQLWRKFQCCCKKPLWSETFWYCEVQNLFLVNVVKRLSMKNV